MDFLLLKRVAWVAIPLGVVLLIPAFIVIAQVGIADGLGWLFWLGAVLFALGVLAALAAWSAKHS